MPFIHFVCAAAVAMFVLGSSAPALAQLSSCGTPGQPWVQVDIQGEWPEGFAERLLADFRAGLEPQGIDVCLPSEAPPAAPIASVRIASGDVQSAAVSVDLKDAVTAKRVGRDVDLSQLPPDGRALAVAVAADELLRASWAELALRGAPKPAAAPPPEVRAVVSDALPRVSDGPRITIGLRMAAERYLGGQTHVGGDVVLRQRFDRRWQAQAYGGLREALGTRTEHGTITGTAATFGAAGLFALVAEPALQLSALAGVHGANLSLRGQPSEQASGAEVTDIVVYAIGGLELSARVVEGLRAELGVGAGLPLRTLDATEAGEAVTGASGGQGHANVGLVGEF